MSTDLVIPQKMTEAFPGLTDSIRRAAELFAGIRTWEDVDRLLIRGQGLSKGTYKTYGYAVKAFYHHSGGLCPLQVVASDVEAWYDTMVSEGLKPSYISTRIAGLKKFFLGVEQQLPGFSSPFRRMPDLLVEKLRGQQKSAECKQAMNQTETRNMLGQVRADTSPKGRQTTAMITTLLTTGLRASELGALSWGDLWRDEDDGRWWLSGSGKGSKSYRLELHEDSLQAIRAARRAMFGHRRPRPEEPLITNTKGGRLTRHVVWKRVSTVGAKLKAAGQVRQGLEFSPHLLRRTLCTLLLKKGMDLKSVQQISRHSDAATLLKHYVDGGESAAPILDEVLRGAA